MRAGTEGSYRSNPDELAASRKKLMDSMYRFHELTGAKFSFGIGSGAGGGKAEVEFMLDCANELAQHGLLLLLRVPTNLTTFLWEAMAVRVMTEHPVVVAIHGWEWLISNATSLNSPEAVNIHI